MQPVRKAEKRERIVPVLVAPKPTIEEAHGVDERGHVWRRVRAGALLGPRLLIDAAPGNRRKGDTLRAVWDAAWLRGGQPVPVLKTVTSRPRRLRVADVFAGCGAMSVGLRLAADSVGMVFESVLAADFNPVALQVFEANLSPKRIISGDLSKTLRYRIEKGGLPKLVIESRAKILRPLAESIDVLIGGPPCQGHSDLNNHSRRVDPKNELYLMMPALAVALRPRAIIIENVPAVVHDRRRVVSTTERLLGSLGYTVDHAIVAMGDLGIAQTRKRHVLVAVQNGALDLPTALEALKSDARSTRWAIGDLRRTQGSALDEPSRQSKENTRRIKWLFRENKYDLPNWMRPACHKDKEHSYVSMYGRMRWDHPAQTVTSGFGSPGQGRYIHPKEPRTITAHEAARLQFFPDTFMFTTPDGVPSKTELSRMIGNAVPPKMSYAIALAVVAALYPGAENASEGTEAGE
jgi:DNA (cytosine-5)-methyltransferase 1